MYDLPLRGIYDLRGGQSSIQAKRTREDALFLPSYINCTSYIVPSYIFLAIFRFLFAYVKKSCIFEGTDTALPSHLENMFASSGTYRQRRVFFVQPNGFWIKCAYRSFYTSINAPYVHFIRKI